MLSIAAMTFCDTAECYCCAIVSSNGYFWIGLNAKEKKWFSNGVEIDYDEEWDSNEPDSNEGECTMAKNGNSQWRTGVCDDTSTPRGRASILCEITSTYI